jgi:hypothetical protein
MRPPLPVAVLLALVACGGDKPAPDPSREVLDRLDALDRRLEALDAKLEAQREVAASAEPSPSEPVADPMRPAPAANGSLKITVTATGFEVEGRTLTEAQLELMLRGVESVTVRAEPGLATERLTAALDLVTRNGIKRVAVASFSAEP